jgi:hypothetical protein
VKRTRTTYTGPLVVGEDLMRFVWRSLLVRMVSLPISLSYVPETKDFTFLDGGWAIEWRTFTASYLDSPGGEAKHARGTVLAVFKKLPDGSWKLFRSMGSIHRARNSRKAGGL